MESRPAPVCGRERLRARARGPVILSLRSVMRCFGAASLARSPVRMRQRRRAQPRCFEEGCLAERLPLDKPALEGIECAGRERGVAHLAQSYEATQVGVA